MSELIEIVYNRFDDIELPEKYQELWNNINLPIQKNKAAFYNLTEAERDNIFNKISKRAYYLTLIAQKFNAKNILEVGTAEGWQFYSFAEYCKTFGAKVWSCDVVDKHDKRYVTEYEEVAHFIHGDSEKLAEHIKNLGVEIDLFYIDGSHEKNAVIKDVLNLKKVQTSGKIPIWIFDDYDERFGCYDDISKIVKASSQYMVYSPGKTASNNPTHQVVVHGRFL